MKFQTNKSLVFQSLILAGAGLLTKIIGFIYRIPMANILGNTGNGVYSVAFGIYGIMLTLSSYSMPISISKIISEQSKTESSIKILHITLFISSVIGLISAFTLFIGAESLSILYNKSGLAIPLKILSPTLFFVAILGCFRGYFQGLGNMIPTALSQIVEQIFNAIVSIVAAKYICLIYSNTSNLSALKAAGGTFGTCVGAFFALLFILIYYLKKRNSTYALNLISFIEFKTYLILLFSIMFPIILSQTIYQIGYTIDDYLFANIMHTKNYSEVYITNVQGVFNTQYTQLINLPISIASAFGVSLLPKISSFHAKNDNLNANLSINKLIYLTTSIVLPSTAGLVVCSEEIMHSLFPKLGTLHELAVNLLFWGGIAAIFYSLSTISTTILQSYCYYKIPVLNAFISLILHITLVIILIKHTNLGIFSLLIGDIIFPFIILLLNILFIKKNIYLNIDFFSTILKPMFGSIIMSITIILYKIIISQYITSVLINLIVEVILGIFIYGLYYFVFSNTREKL